MKIKFLIASIAAIIFFCINTTMVHAEEDLEDSELGLRVYNLSYDTYNANISDLYHVHYEGTIISYTRVCFLICGERTVVGSDLNNTTATAYEFVYNPPEGGSTRSNHKFLYESTQYSQDGKLIKKMTDIEGSFGALSLYALPSQGTGYINLKTDIPIFSSYDDMLYYFETGDYSSSVNYEFSKKHDFASDYYDPSIPVPEINHISYDGFRVLNNKDSQYIVDVVAESNFLGLKIETGITTSFVETDPDWIFSSHYYNIADSGKAGKNSQINFPSQYGFSPLDDLMLDFKKWSELYPDVNDLPGYNWLRHPDNRFYKQLHVYGYPTVPENKEKEISKLMFTEQAKITYYVRFRDDSGAYGAWSYYSFIGVSDSAYNKVQISQVEVDENGNIKVDSDGRPILKDVLTGQQSSDGEDVKIGSGSIFDINIMESLGLNKIGDMFGYLKSKLDGAVESLNSFGSLISACFSFLPEELTGFIILGIVLMMLIGIIKAVI